MESRPSPLWQAHITPENAWARPRVFAILGMLTLLLSGCVATAVGAAASATIGVATAVITAPIKVGGAVVDAVSDDEDEEDD